MPRGILFVIILAAAAILVAMLLTGRTHELASVQQWLASSIGRVISGIGGVVGGLGDALNDMLNGVVENVGFG